MITTESPPTQIPQAGPLHDHRGFPKQAVSVKNARGWLASRLVELHILGDPADDLLLLVAELATNAVIHAGSSFEVLIYEPHGGYVHVAVRDWGSHRVTLRKPDLDAVGGRGLMLVKSLSCHWGVMREREKASKVVFAVVALAA